MDYTKLWIIQNYRLHKFIYYTDIWII